MFNRLHNVHNPYQGTEKRVLTVCSAGLLRSPTAAWVLSNSPYNYNTRSCGVHDYALIRIDYALIEWADEIVFVEPYLLRDTKFLFPERPDMHRQLDKKAVVLDIDDKYERMHPELIQQITEQYNKINENRKAAG